MSLNIDITRILLVKVSSSSPIFGIFIELQRIESWEDVPFEFNWLSTDSIKVSVVLKCCDPFYPVLPSFVGIWMLMDLSKTLYRIWKDVDLRALKIDDSFVTN